MPLHRSPPLRALLIALSLLPAGAGAAEYTVMDSGAILAEYPSIQWMDEHRVIFLGSSGEFCRRSTAADSYRKPLPRIAIFDTRTMKLSWHGEVGVARLCHDKGRVSYVRQIVKEGLCPDDEWEHLRGRLGEETIQPAATIGENCLPEPEDAAEARKAWVEQVVAREKEKNGQVLRMTRLREEHGWLAFHDSLTKTGRFLSDHPIAIYPPGKEDKPIPVDRTPFEPWLAQDYGVRLIRYEAFKGAYLLGVDDNQGTGREFSVLWWLYPNGRLELALQHRREKGWEHFFHFGIVQTQTGVLAVGGKSDPHNDKNGVYWRRTNGRPEMIDRGLVNQRGFASDHPLSPDGCKLAYGIHPKGFGNWPAIYHLRVIDTCTSDGR